MTPEQLETELDMLLQQSESHGFSESIVESLRFLGTPSDHWRPMRSIMDRKWAARAPSDRLFKMRDAVRAVCPPGPGWLPDHTFAQTTATPILFEQWLPGPKVVARRSLCLAGVLTRCHIEARALAFEESTQEQRAHLAGRLWNWIDREGLIDELSPEELSWFEKPVGGWTQDDRWLAGWRAEALGILLWSLGRIASIPPPDRGFAPGQLTDPIPLWRSTGEFVATACLADDIGSAFEAAGFWHWRAQRMSRGKRLLSPVVRDAVAGASKTGLVNSVVDGDLAVFGKPYFALTDEEESKVCPAIYQRHFALAWLTGGSQEWDDTPTDT